MPSTLTYPGVYIEEIPSGVRTITGVATSITAFVGRALMGPVNKAVTINGFGDYERIFGGLWLSSSMSYAVRDFFLNQGGQAIIVRLFAPTDTEQQAALTTAQTQAGAAADAVIAAATAANTGTPSQEDIAAAAEGAVTAAGAVSPAALSAATAVAQAARAAVAVPPLATTTGANRTAIITAATNAKAAAVTAAAASAVPNNRSALATGGTTSLNLEAANEGVWGNDLRARIDYDVKDGAPDLFNLSLKNTKTGQTEVHRNLSLSTNSARRVDKVLAAESQLARTSGALPAARPTASAPAAVVASAGPPPVAAVPAGVVAAGTDPFGGANSSGVTTQASDGRTLVANDFTPNGGETDKRGIYALLQADLFNLLCLPPFETDGDMDSAVVGSAAAFCEKRRAMLLLDPPVGWRTVAQAAAGASGVGTSSKNSALYFPRLLQPNPLRANQFEEFVPCGAIAGVMSRTDATRGVWKAPAGLDATLVGVPALSVSLTDAENGQLNPLGVNCLRVMPAAGRIVWGARTMQGDDRMASEWKYIPVRRTALFIEESLYRGTQWVVFEPNDEPLWSQIRLNLGAFMHNLFRQGAFQGTTPRDAYFVKCDKETTTQNDINLGIVNIIVGFAPLKPAEFVIIKLQQMAGQIET